MPIPDEARPPWCNQTSIVRRAEHPANTIKREVKILIADNLPTVKHKVTINASSLPVHGAQGMDCA